MNFFYDLIPFQERIRPKQLLFNQQIVKSVKKQQPLLIKKSQEELSGLQKKNVWKTVESRRYITFLRKKGYLYSLSTSQKKNLRVNVQMSNAVKTRTPIQCHSHHQKMMKKYGTIEQIIESHDQAFLNFTSHFQKKVSLSPDKQVGIENENKSEPNLFYLEDYQYETERPSYFYAYST